jgi:hypothetical protein
LVNLPSRKGTPVLVTWLLPGLALVSGAAWIIQ